MPAATRRKLPATRCGSKLGGAGARGRALSERHGLPRPETVCPTQGLAARRRQARRQRAGAGAGRRAAGLRDAAGLPKPERALGKPRFEPGLEHLDPDRSAKLEPPWPDLILTVGRRPSMAALWVQDRSGGRARIVLVGRPAGGRPVRADRRAQPVPHPRRGNLVQLALPLMRRRGAGRGGGRGVARSAGRPAPAADRGAGRRDEAVPLRRRGGARPARRAGAAPGARRRDALPHDQPAHAPEVAALEAGLLLGAKLYRWTPDTGADNLPRPPGARRPVRRHRRQRVDDGRGREPGRLAIFPCRSGAARGPSAPPWPARGGRFGAAAHLLHRLGLAGYARDLTEIHRLLFERGLAVPLGEPFRPPTGPLTDELRGWSDESAPWSAG